VNAIVPSLQKHLNQKFKEMKKILFAAAVLASSMTFAQSNTKGTIHLGLGWVFKQEVQHLIMEALQKKALVQELTTA